MRIATKILKAILLAAGKKDLRQYLNGVHINERHIVATDGHRLHAYSHGREWPHGPVTIPRGAVEMALKAKTVDIEITDVSVGAVSHKPLDGKYPDYMRVIPGVNVPAGIAPPRVVASLNAEYMQDAQAFATATGCPEGTANFLTLIGNSWTWQTQRAAAVVMAVGPTLKCPNLTSLEQFK